MKLIYDASRVRRQPLPDGECCCDDPDEYGHDDDCGGGGLWNHSYDVLEHFGAHVEGEDSGEPLLGVELELEDHSRRGTVRGSFFEAYAAAPLFIGKSDGSVDNGIELVTLPLTYDAHLQVATALHPNWWAHTRARPNCGMHVHISRGSFNGKEHERRFAHFFSRHNGHGELSDEWDSFLTALVRRSENTYCVRAGSGARMADDGSRNRYMAVNFCNEHTLEVRAFAATRSINVYMANVELVHAVFTLTKYDSGPAFEATKTPWRFIKHVREVWANEYPHLAARLGIARGSNDEALFEAWLSDEPEVIGALIEPLPLHDYTKHNMAIREAAATSRAEREEMAAQRAREAEAVRIVPASQVVSSDWLQFHQDSVNISIPAASEAPQAHGGNDMIRPDMNTTSEVTSCA